MTREQIQRTSFAGKGRRAVALLLALVLGGTAIGSGLESPLGLIARISPLPGPDTLVLKISHFPSGDHADSLVFPGVGIRLASPLPSAGLSHTVYALATSELYESDLPSGVHAGKLELFRSDVILSAGP